jgi:uncharacterized protein YihD (DUF1040 family)
MRPANRINRIIELLRQYWQQNPDLRLGQIIANNSPSYQCRCMCHEGRENVVCFRYTDPFYVEDDLMEDNIMAGLRK